MAFGVFTSAGVGHAREHRKVDVSYLEDLLLYSLDDLADIAAEKGSIWKLLDEKWRKVYQATGEQPVMAVHTRQIHAG